MKILWITNQLPKDLAEKLNIESSYGVGWLQQVAKQLSIMENVEMGILFPVYKEIGYDETVVNNIKIYPSNIGEKTFNDSMCERKIKNKIKNFNPDIIHIWGTEYLHTYQIVKICEELNISNKVVISIQGLVSVVAKHYKGYMEDKYFNKSSMRDIIRNDSLKKQRKRFEYRGVYEVKAIEKVNNVIGRTDWDEACTTQINPHIKYYFCNETLRETFYRNVWDLEQCDKYSLFLSQSSYPIKGLHLLLEALEIIVKKYPNTHLYVTGKNRLTSRLQEKILFSQYDNYLLKLIKKYNLEDNITFLNSLNEEEMCRRFLKTHVFVSASSIENSPNSLGEAMLLGVPSVSSDVGGVKSMFEHGKDGYLYPADEPYMLAYYVMKIFENDDIALKFSRNSRKRALKTHDAENNLNQLLNIYNSIIKDKE